MKFNCDRCNTRYSISDARVSGKVLKIRCKNCTAVITVREGMNASAPQPRESQPVPTVRENPRPRSNSALRGAFDDAMSSPSAADSMSGAPASLVTEWYMAIDGNQSGPFDLSGAHGWITKQSHAAELFCWSEGFDDWLPVEKVSQFRDSRNGATRPGRLSAGFDGGTPVPTMPSFDANVEKTPAPLFKATMDKVTSEAPTIVPNDDLFAAIPAAASSEPDEHGAFEFDIGEASRVVNLASIMPAAAGAAKPVARNADLPGMGGAAPTPLATIRGATSPELELPRPGVLLPQAAKRSRVLLPLLIASGALAVVLGVLLFLAFRGGGSEEEEIARGNRGGEDLAHQFDPERGGGDGKSPEKGTDPEKATKTTGKTTKRNGNTGNTGNTSGSKAVVSTNGKAGYTRPSDEVDLTPNVNAAGVRQGSLEPDDIFTVYRRAQFSVNRCYERSIKKNPLLRVGRTNVTLKISGSGKVTNVSIPSLAGENLGSCLVVAIGRWRFPKSTEGFRGTFPIVFRK